MPNATSFVRSLKSCPLPHGAYLLKEAELTEKGQVSLQLRYQLKIYTNNSFVFAFVHPSYALAKSQA